MSLREQISTSFIKSLGKTAGVVTIFGVVGGMWYIYSNTRHVNKRVSKKINRTEFLNMEAITTEKDDFVEEEDEDLNLVQKNDDLTFKRIFDKL